MKLGFTGTRRGMTAAQRETVKKILERFKPSEVHHGDCVGADSELHEMCQSLSIPIVIHPPKDESRRAFCEGAVLEYNPKSHLKRNHEIVDTTEMLIGTPAQDREILRSGTWATVRYARKKSNPVVLTVKRDGELEVDMAESMASLVTATAVTRL